MAVQVLDPDDAYLTYIIWLVFGCLNGDTRTPDYPGRSSGWTLLSGHRSPNFPKFVQIFQQAFGLSWSLSGQLVRPPKSGQKSSKIPPKKIACWKFTWFLSCQVTASGGTQGAAWDFSFLDKIVENACNFMNSCSIYIKISASQSLCKYEGDCVFRFWW